MSEERPLELTPEAVEFIVRHLAPTERNRLLADTAKHNALLRSLLDTIHNIR